MTESAGRRSSGAYLISLRAGLIFCGISVLIALALFLLQAMQVLPDIDPAGAGRPVPSILQRIADIPGVEAAVDSTRGLGPTAGAQAKSRYVIEYAALFAGYAITAVTVLVLLFRRRDWKGLFRNGQRPDGIRTIVAIAFLVAISIGFGAIAVFNPDYGVFGKFDYACLGLPLSCALALLCVECAIARWRLS